LNLPGELAVKRILKPVTYVLAALYFLVDAAFMAIAKPDSDWLARHVVLRRLRTWIRSLRPYPSLALFSVPVIILEPIKPVAAYLAATGQMMSSVVTLIVGELLKLVLVERLFSLTRDKLMKIPAFLWAYMGHPLVRSAALIDRKFLDDRFGSVCQTGPGHPGISEKAAYPQAVSSAVVIIPA
jgi:hypothetical protein